MIRFPNVFAGKKAADVTEDMYTAFAMGMWNFAKVNADGTLTGNGTGTVYDLAKALPTIDDMYNEVYAMYGGDGREVLDDGERRQR